MTPNGPAIKGGCVTRREHRAESRFFSQKIITVQGGYGMRFCSQGTEFCGLYERRGTSFQSGRQIISALLYY
jgi:hypothetical protein